MKVLHMTTLLLLLLLLACANTCSSSLVQTTMDSGFCDDKCEVRCSKAGRKEDCLKYCGICCRECDCVPSGTYGHKDECPCYRDKKNSKGNPKCP